MRFFQKIKDSPHYLRLKESVEYRHDRKQFILMSVLATIFLIPMAVLFALGCGNPTENAVAVAMDFFLMLMVFCFWLYTGYRWLEIFLHIDSYIFFQARLDQPHLESHRYSSRVRFTVEFTDRHGKQRKRDTSALFSSTAEPYFEDHNNQTVLVAYNEETDRVVIIGLVNVS